MAALTFDQALTQGIEAHKAGEVQEADRLYTAILKAQPKHPDANHNMGLLAVGVGKVEKALPFFKTALEANPAAAQFWLSYIDALIKLDKLAGAKAVLDQAKSKGAKGDGFDKLEQRLQQARRDSLETSKIPAEVPPPQPNILDSLKLDQAIKIAKKKSKDGSTEEARRIYQDILTKFPKNKRASYGLKGLADKTFGKASKVQDPPQDQLQSLVNLYSQGQLQQALKQAGTLVQQFPKSPVLFTIQGALLKMQGQFELSLKAYNRALTIKPDYADAYYNMGVTLKEQGKLEEAIEAYNKALAIKPDFSNVYNNLGNALKEQGNLEEAIEAYNQVLAINPDSSIAYNNLGVILEEQGKLKEAIEAYNKALNIKPDSAEVYYNLGIVLKDQGKLEEAIEAYNNALAIEPNYADAYNNMGNALKDQGKSEKSIEAFNKALASKPDHADAYYNLGLTLKEQGKLEEAIEAYNQVLAINPNFHIVHNNLGVIFQEQGKLEEAIEAYNKTLNIQPDCAEAKHNLVEILKIYSPKNIYRSPLINLDTVIKAKHNKHKLPTVDQELADYMLSLLNKLQSADKNLSTQYLQIYRQNNVDLNCKRHMQIFKEKEIIPKFCFGCYKVQVDVTTVLDLIRLAALFYESEFENDLIRKCLVEIRPNISGFYKGLIYCRGIDQAHSVKTQLDVHLRRIDKNLIAKIKKGCSEFPLAFPEYGEVAASEKDMMQFPQEWQSLETEFDNKSLVTPKTNLISSLKEFCLSDYLIIHKWIDYAKGIGDPTSELFCDLPVKYNEIVKVAKARVKQ